MTEKYCSIDLEFTGFDPEKEQILEIGFAFFEISEDGISVGETWSQVFKPTIEVHPKILGLTGISQEEVDAAPSIHEYREFLSEKLSDAILIAHNPTLDVKFLEMAGVKLSGRVIDTLELVQFLLPTYHSYNLENLMHYFSIEHKDSHRALGDALATASLLEKMLFIYSNFSAELKQQLANICTKAEFEWSRLLQIDFKNNFTLPQVSFPTSEKKPQLDLAQKIIIDSDYQNQESNISSAASQQEGLWLVAMHDKKQVIKLWQQGLIEGAFEPEDLFSPQGFENFLHDAQTSEELRFCLKILVWLNTNWQTKTVLDLNLSFFGGQFKNFIVGNQYQESSSKVLACDYKTLQFISTEQLESVRHLIVCDMQRFEKFLTNRSKDKLSWNSFQYTIKNIYNPETGLGEELHKDQVIESLAAVDLFFGLTQIVLRQYGKDLDYISLEQLELYQSVYLKRLATAADNLSQKLSALATKSENFILQKLSKELQSFFDISEKNVVKWIELTEDNAFLHAQLIKIEELANQYTNNFSASTYADSYISGDLLLYLSERLGFNTEKFNTINKSELLDKVLYSGAQESNTLKDFIFNLTSPAVVVFPSANKIKSFYKDHFVELKNKFHIFAQEYSGSGNKIFRNFRIFDNSLLMATSSFINKQKYRIQAEQILYIEAPLIDTNHPYYVAMKENYVDKYANLENILLQGNLILNIKQISENKTPTIIAPDAILQLL